MRILKLIWSHFVDIGFGLMALVLLIVYLVNTENNFTGFLALVVGYVSFNVLNKIRYNNNPELWKPKDKYTKDDIL